MYAEIASALTSIKTFGDLTTLILKMKVDSAVTEKAIESQSAIISLQSTMLTLQSQYQALLDEKEELKKRLIEMEDWKTEAEKYELKEIAFHTFAYALKSDYANTAPAHWLCANCYGNGQKSILQSKPATSKGLPYSCLRCNGEIITRGRPGEA